MFKLYLRFILSMQLMVLAVVFISPVYAVEDSMFINFSTQKLIKGRTLWIENCKGCHAYGTADAPIPMEPKEWKLRLMKDRDVLYKHAINGFFGPDYAMMPPRGGNDDLSDDQVKLAVDYMVALAEYYAKQKH